MSKLLIGFIVIGVLLILFHIKKNNKEYFSSEVSIDCVVARYNESVSWINMIEFNSVTRFLIYNKGKPLTVSLPDNAYEIMVPNVGKCDHTYLHHIINNYNNLADITMFVSGRADDSRKGPKILNTMRRVNQAHDTTFIGMNILLPDNMWDFTIDKWLSTNPENHIGEGIIDTIAPSSIRPFGNWFNYHWPGKKIKLFPFQSIFAIHKRHILQYPIQYYYVLYEELNYDINPEAGHYMERAWGMVFSPFPKKCIYYDS